MFTKPDRKRITYFWFVCVFFLSLPDRKLAAGDFGDLQQRSRLLENQVKVLAREQHSLANQLIRNGVHQVEKSAKQVRIAQTVQTLAANALASKGLDDVNSKICFH